MGFVGCHTTNKKQLLGNEIQRRKKEMGLFARKVNRYIRKIQSGKEEALKKLYDCTYSMVRRMAMEVCTGQEELEETLYEVYTDIFENIEESAGSKDGYGWFCGRVKKKILKIKQKRTGVTDSDNDNDPEDKD